MRSPADIGAPQVCAPGVPFRRGTIEIKPPDVAELARVIAASAGYWLGLPGAPGPTNPMEQAA